MYVSTSATCLQPGDYATIEMPFSEACMSLRVADTVMLVQLTDSEFPMAQLIKDGRNFSASILPCEAGIYRDESGYYVYGVHEAFRCPCCGDDVFGMRPVCDDCREASCQMTTDASGDTDWFDCQRPPAVTYERIIFMQGNDADEPLDLLYNRESADSIVYHGPTEESITAALEYLAQWDYGDPGEETDTPSAGTSDDSWTVGGYLMSANLGLGYIGLERIVTVR